MVDNQHWLDRWQENRIGFHESSVNRHLQNWFHQFAPEPGSRVFMPLCGKAQDIQWIERQGYQVIGVELSEIAIEAFFDENDIRFERSESDRFTYYQSPGISMLQGDFFDLDASDLSGCRLPTDEIMRRYRDAFAVELLHSENIVDERPRWREVGLSALQESVFRLTR